MSRTRFHDKPGPCVDWERFSKIGLAEAAGHECWQLWIQLANPCKALRTIDVRHGHVDHHHVDAVTDFRDPTQCRTGILARDNGEAFKFEQQTQ